MVGEPGRSGCYIRSLPPEVVVVWPWEHLAFGYLVYSVVARRLGGQRPGRADAIALVIGTQVPDLIDKPLGWGTTILPSGYSLGHSLLVAIPLSGLVLALAFLTDNRAVGIAFTIGYLVHLPGDIVYPLLLGGDIRLSFLLWPVVPAADQSTVSVIAHVRHLAGNFLGFLSTPRGQLYLLLEALLVGTAALRWFADGLPGARWPVRRWVRGG